MPRRTSAPFTLTHRFMPRLEALEARDCPAAPSLSFTAEILGGTSVRLSGIVTDESPETSFVRFTGAASGLVYPDSAGTFSLTVTGNYLGTITGQATDSEKLHSQPQQATISSNTPTLTLERTYGPYGTVILSGTVTDEDPAGRTVYFSGAVEDSVVTDAQGNFTLTTLGWDLGTVTASTQDPWGQPSNTPQVTLANAAPEIRNFLGIRTVNNWWTFTGQVIDEWAPGLVVTLASSHPNLFAQVTVSSNNTFTYTVQLPSGWISSTVTAQTWDWWNVASEEEVATIWE